MRSCDKNSGPKGEWDLFVGQRVVCINDCADRITNMPVPLRLNAVYTIREIYAEDVPTLGFDGQRWFGVGLSLREVPDRTRADLEPFNMVWAGWDSRRFRALPARAVEQFRAVALTVGGTSKAVVRVDQ